MKRLLLPIVGLGLIASGFGAGIAVSATAADDPAPVTVTRQPLAEAIAPPGAAKRTLGLSKVTVMPGSMLATHHHPGQQLGYIAEGTLTYTVESGSARLMKGSGEDPTLIKRIKPGDTVKVTSGQWLIEEQGEEHHASNDGTIPVVIYLSTLFKTGKPSAIFD